MLRHYYYDFILRRCLRRHYALIRCRFFEIRLHYGDSFAATDAMMPCCCLFSMPPRDAASLCYDISARYYAAAILLPRCYTLRHFAAIIHFAMPL